MRLDLHQPSFASYSFGDCHVAGPPCVDFLFSIGFGLPPLSFDHLSRSAAARLIGNEMCVPCVGSVMHWCAVFCATDLIDVPRALNDSHAPLAGNVAIPFSSDEVDSGCCRSSF